MYTAHKHMHAPGTLQVGVHCCYKSNRVTSKSLYILNKLWTKYDSSKHKHKSVTATERQSRVEVQKDE